MFCACHCPRKLRHNTIFAFSLFITMASVLLQRATWLPNKFCGLCQKRPPNLAYWELKLMLKRKKLTKRSYCGYSTNASNLLRRESSNPMKKNLQVRQFRRIEKGRRQFMSRHFVGVKTVCNHFSLFDC